MPSNIEIKARVSHRSALEARICRLADRPSEEIGQEDVFFHSSHGRLKLRKFSRVSGELIQYQREDDSGPTRSRYTRVETADPAGLERALTAALGVRGVVRKTRTLYLVGQTRIHLDEVEHLGSFLELEVVLTPDESTEHGERVARDLLKKLEIREQDLISSAYLDLLEELRVVVVPYDSGWPQLFEAEERRVRAASTLVTGVSSRRVGFYTN